LTLIRARKHAHTDPWFFSPFLKNLGLFRRNLEVRVWMARLLCAPSSSPLLSCCSTRRPFFLLGSFFFPDVIYKAPRPFGACPASVSASFSPSPDFFMAPHTKFYFSIGLFSFSFFQRQALAGPVSHFLMSIPLEVPSLFRSSPVSCPRRFFCTFAVHFTKHVFSAIPGGRYGPQSSLQTSSSFEGICSTFARFGKVGFFLEENLSYGGIDPPPTPDRRDSKDILAPPHTFFFFLL